MLIVAGVLVSTNESERVTPTTCSMVNGLASAWLAAALLALVEKRGYARRLRSEGATRLKGLFGVQKLLVFSALREQSRCDGSIEEQPSTYVHLRSAYLPTPDVPWLAKV